jgi:hypothetical protein
MFMFRKLLMLVKLIINYLGVRNENIHNYRQSKR